MAQLGKFEKRVLDSHGNPISGATVEVRTQGAFVTSTQAGPTYTVNDPGGIVSGTSTCVVNTTTTPSRACTGATATTVTFGILGFGSLVNNDRITVTDPLPTLYADAQGAETTSNPLTTDANGYCYAWIEVQPLDVKISATGHGTSLETDVIPGGQEYVVSNLFSQAGVTVFRRGTTRTLTAGRLMTLENPIASDIKWECDYAGNVTQDGNLTVGGNLAVTGTTALTGNVTMTGDLTVDDITMDDLTADDISVGDLTVSGAISLPAGGLETADLADNCTYSTAVGTGTTDFATAAGYAAITGATVTITPNSTDSEFVIMAVVPVTTDAAASVIYAQVKNGSTVLNEAGCIQSFAGSAPVVISLLARQTGLSGAQTWTVEVKASVASKVLSSSTDQKAKLVVMEFKK